MITVKGTTKRGQQLFARGKIIEGACLEDVYCSYSKAKRYAYEYCLDEYRNCKEPSWGFAICSHNAQFFSVSWFTTTGMHLITPYNHYFITLSDEQIESESIYKPVFRY